MQLPLAYFDASVIEEVPADLWRQVFDAVGWPASLTVKQNAFTHADILDAFESDTPTDDLLQAIEALHTLGGEAGRDAIAAAMNDRRVSMQVFPASSGERELAIRLFLAQRHDASLAEVFARAQAQVEEGTDHRRYNEFLGKEARTVTNLQQKGDALREEMLQYCSTNDLGDHVHVRTFEDDGAYVFHVIRGHHTKKPLAVIPGRSARATIEYRPVHGDVLRYDAVVGKIRIAARAASVIEPYRQILGRVLFDDDLFFAGEPVCSLKILQERGPKALADHSVPGIGRVWMTECLWERSDRDVLQIRSNDCFRTFEELGLALTEGELVQAKLKLEVAGRSTRPLSISIRTPSRIEISQKRHEQLADQFLSAVGIRNAARRVSEIDLWSLDPWRHPVAVWRTLFRGKTDTLIQDGVLVPIQLGSIPSSEHAGSGRVLEAQIVSDGKIYGVSRAPEIPPRSLSSTDLDGLELKPEPFRIYLRKQLGISGPSDAWHGGELLNLGDFDIGDQRVRVFYAIRQPQSGVGDRIRVLAVGAHPVVLFPTPRSDGNELARVALRDPLPSRKQITREAIVACGLSSVVPAIHSAPDGTRLVVDSRFGKIWVDDIEIVGLRAGTHPFRLVEILAKTPRSVSTNELTNELSGARKDGDTTARQAKTAARKLIEAAMTNAGRVFDEDPFPSVPAGHYRCAFLSHVV